MKCKDNGNPKCPSWRTPQFAHVMDEPPGLEINSSTMGVNAIRNMLEVHDCAVAICQGAHLANLKAYTQKFTSCLTQIADSESRLRYANILEAQHDDQKIWGVIAVFMANRGWTINDSLHELTSGMIFQVGSNCVPGFKNLHLPGDISTWSGPWQIQRQGQV